MAGDDFITTNAGEKQETPPAGCVFVCPSCRHSELGPGEKLCSVCQQREEVPALADHCITAAKEDAPKSRLDESSREACEALKELRDLAVEIRGLAQVVKAGKVPSVRKINRIAHDLTTWESEFNYFLVEFISDAIACGQGIIH